MFWRPQHHGGRRVLRPIIDAAPETHRRQPGVVPRGGDERDLRPPHVKPRPEAVSEEAPFPLDRTRHRVAEPVRPVRRRGVIFDDARAGRRGNLLGVQGLGNGVRGSIPCRIQDAPPHPARHSTWISRQAGLRSWRARREVRKARTARARTRRRDASCGKLKRVSGVCRDAEVHAWWFEYALLIHKEKFDGVATDSRADSVMTGAKRCATRLSTAQSSLGKRRFCRKIADSFRMGKSRPTEDFSDSADLARHLHGSMVPEVELQTND